jgi:hypothetical protein
MTVTVTELLETHDEWTEAYNRKPTIVTNALAAAHTFYSEDSCGVFYNDMVILKTCQLLANHPKGRNMRLKSESETTLYDKQLETYEMIVGTCLRYP